MDDGMSQVSESHYLFTILLIHYLIGFSVGVVTFDLRFCSI